MIKFKAKVIRAKYKINSTSNLGYLKLVIHKMGYNLCTYSEEKMKLVRLKREQEMKTAPSLSIIDSKGNITVYYNDILSSIVQRFALAHEIGHIVLGHKHRNLNGKKQEDEADKFAEYLLAPERDKQLSLIRINCLILCVCFLAMALCKIFIKDSANDTELSVISNSTVFDSINNDISVIIDNTTCYYARYSQVYHIYRDCYYLKNSKTVYTDTVGGCNKDRLCSACERRKNTE